MNQHEVNFKRYQEVVDRNYKIEDILSLLLIISGLSYNTWEKLKKEVDEGKLRIDEYNDFKSLNIEPDFYIDNIRHYVQLNLSEILTSLSKVASLTSIDLQKLAESNLKQLRGK